MDFFNRQDDARRMTRRFVILFVVTVFAVAITIYLGLSLFMVRGTNGSWLGDGEIFLWTVGGTLLFILVGGAFKTWELERGGGAAVARSLGGQEIQGNEDDPAIRQFHNVAQEMSIAAGCPMPRLFVLNEESGINAFAAGLDPAHAAIGVTRGALTHFDRSELQAVVAHEFGHIVNGDMRLNIKMIGVLHGLLMLSVTGYWILRVSGRVRVSKSSGQVQLFCVAAGLVLAVVGWIGVVGGRVIKSAVSRQREYFADASATQFTRYPEALASALKKIGSKAMGSWIKTPASEEMSHLFIGDHTNGQGLKSAMFSWTSTHPPLGERIRRLDPTWNGEFDIDMSIKNEEDRAPVSQLNKIPHVETTQLILTAGILDSVGGVSIDNRLRETVKDPFGAWAVVLALLLRENSADASKSLGAIAANLPKGLIREIKRVWAVARTTGEQERLTLIEFALPALQSLEDKADEILASCREVIFMDGRQTSYELFVEQILESSLSIGEMNAPRAVKGNVRQASRILFSHLAVAGHGVTDEARHSFAAAWESFDGRWAEPYKLEANLEEVGQLKQAFRVLKRAAPTVKSRILKASCVAVLHDDKVTAEERALVGAAALAMAIPIPDLDNFN